ncbi:MAG: EF-P beta-lysylation protein EpmB [Chromatiales bacterium]|nr:MAG: EF-P beta-lysylation protein EpmB [Chromatiales bacterium]
MAAAYRRPEELLAELGLDPGNIHTAMPDFPLRVPHSYVRRMRCGDPQDPLLLQVLPQADEHHRVAGFTDDPVGDLASARRPGLLRKYTGRALIITTGACAVHCRYCFRRAFPYHENLSDSTFTGVLDELRRDTSIREVILSGGDPLSLSDRRLEALLQALDTIPHVRRIRLHTRTPVVLPERVDAPLLRVLAQLRKPLVTVLHCNHANEIDAAVADAVAGLRARSAAVLNQSVLLRGINDSPDALVDLSEALFAAGVLPYYLHQLDPVAGAAHFAVDDDRARACVTGAAARLPGYLVPRLVREVAGADAKLPLQT